MRKCCFCPNCCSLRKKIVVRRQSQNSVEKMLVQYETLNSEYLQCLSGSQNVITINIAMSMGIIAAIATMISLNLNSNWRTFLLILPIMGLVVSVACIRTLRHAMKELKRLQSLLVNMELSLELNKIHEVTVYKPLHITLVAFVLNAFFFVIMVILSLAQSEAFISFLSAHKFILICTFIVLIVMFFLIFISESLYKKKMMTTSSFPSCSNKGTQS